MINWMEDQPRSLLEMLWDFCESGDVVSLAKGDTTVLPASCTQISKIGFYIMVRLLKRSMTWMNKVSMKKVKKADAKIFDKLSRLKYGLKKTMPMKGGLQMIEVEKFLAAVDLARGQLTKNITHDNSGKIDMQTHGLWAFGTLKDGAHTPQ